jgi:hypothetical protein
MPEEDPEVRAKVLTSAYSNGLANTISASVLMPIL